MASLFITPGLPAHDAAARQFFDAALPGIDLSPPDADRVRASATALIDERYGATVTLAMIFGSHALGSARPLSDCDLLVVRESEAPNEKVQLVVDGIAMELSAYRLDDLRGLLRQAEKGGALDLPSMVAISQPLYGDAALHTTLVETARRIMLMPGPAIPSAAREQMLSRASSMLIKFIAVADRYDAIRIAGRLAALLAFLVLRFETGRSYDSPGYALCGLRRADAAAADQLEDAVRALVDQDDRCPMIAAAATTLERLGGACWHGLRIDIPGPFRPTQPT